MSTPEGEKPRRVWTPAGSVLSTTPENAYLRAHASIIEAMGNPTFKANIDQQVSVIFHIKKNSALLGTPALYTLLDEMCQHLDGFTIARLTGILQLESSMDIRDALEATFNIPRPDDSNEGLYPKKGWLGAYLSYARESNAPTSYHFWVGAAVLGSAMRRNVYLNLRYKLYPNLYLAVVGDSGLGKGTAFGTGEPIIKLANEIVVETLLDYQWAPGLPYPPDRRVKLLPKMLSPELLIKSLSAKDFVPEPGDRLECAPKFLGEDSVGLLLNEELVSLAGKHVYGAATLFHIITALYTCDDIDRGTIARDTETLKNPALTFAVGSTLEWINRSITPDMFEGGFMSRCMFCYRNREHERFHYTIPPPRDPVLRHTLAATLVPWMLLNPPRAAVFTPGARRLWDTICTQNQQLMAAAADFRMVPYYRRRDNHIGKVAMILMASDLVANYTNFDVELLEARPSYTLTEETLLSALRIIEEEEKYMVDCFAKIGEHQDSLRLDQVVAFIKKGNVETEAPVPLHTVHRRAKEVFGTEALKVMMTLRGMGLVKLVELPKRGLPQGRTPMGYLATGWATKLAPDPPTPIDP